jgi:type I restriction enzyme, R subunit
MNESQTRQEIIDKHLARAGWLVDHPGMVTREFDIFLEPDVVKETRSPYGGHQFSDYVLLKKDSSPQAVVEAKKASRDAQLGQEQALQYAQNIQEIHGGDLPFIFYTNGHDIFFWDYGNYPPQKMYGFPTRDDLEHMEFQRKEKRPLSPELINPDIAGRAYQIEAIRTILENIEKSRRKMLLVMAPEQGKPVRPSR